MHAALLGFSSYASPSSNDDPHRNPRTASEHTRSEQLAGKRVVIVEDEGITQLQLKRLLALAGLLVVGLAADGAAGVETVLREKPDIVLMDVKMPGQYDGLEATRRILAEMSICVIMLTAFEEYQEQASALGVCGYIVKPVDSASLIPRVVDAYARFLPQ